MMKPLLAAIAAASFVALGACTQETRVEDQTPAEQSAENAGNELEQAAENAGNELEQAGENAGNAVDDATDNNNNSETTNP